MFPFRPPIALRSAHRLQNLAHLNCHPVSVSSDVSPVHVQSSDAVSVRRTGYVRSAPPQNQAFQVWILLHLSPVHRNRIPQFFIGCLLIAPLQILTDTSLKKNRTLLYHTDFFAEFSLRILCHWHAVNFYISFLRIIESRNQAYQCTLTASGSSDDSDRLPFLCLKTDV